MHPPFRPSSRWLWLALAALPLAGCRMASIVPFNGGGWITAGSAAHEATVASAVQDAVATLLARHVTGPTVRQVFVEHAAPPASNRRRICFLGVDATAPPDAAAMADRAAAAVEDRIGQSQCFELVDRRPIVASLEAIGVEAGRPPTPDELRSLVADLDRQGLRLDALLFARVSPDPPQPPGFRKAGHALGLTLVELADGGSDTESARL